MACRFHKNCKYFDLGSVTCSSYDADGGYCGQYRELYKKLVSAR